MNSIYLPLLISSLAGLGTLIGGLVVYIKFKDSNKFISFALSFSLSVMINLSVFDLIPESFKVLTKNYGFAWSIILGSAVFILGKSIVTKLHNKINPHSYKNNLYRVGLLNMIALMIHNFPEGIATFMSAYNDLGTGISLAVAIMMHNIPEGISISVPIYYATNSKKRGVIYSLISGLAEPLGAISAYILLKNIINDITISIILILVAGIMITIAIEEMLPESTKYNYKYINIIGMVLGLVLVVINLILF